MNKGYYFIVDLVIYPFDIMVSIDESDKVLLKRLKIINKQDKKNLEMNHNAIGRAVMLSTNQSVIRIKSVKDKSLLWNRISHEIFHCVTFLMNRLNMPLADYNDEAYAYLIGYITENIHKNLR